MKLDGINVYTVICNGIRFWCVNDLGAFSTPYDKQDAKAHFLQAITDAAEEHEIQQGALC